MLLLLGLLWSATPDTFCVGHMMGVGVVTSRVQCAGPTCRLSISAGNSYAPGRIGVREARLDPAWIRRGKDLAARASRAPERPSPLDASQILSVWKGRTTNHPLESRIPPSQVEHDLEIWFSESQERLERSEPLWTDSLVVEWTGPRSFRLRTISPDAAKRWVADRATIRFSLGGNRIDPFSHQAMVDTTWEDRGACAKQLAQGRSCEIGVGRDASFVAAWIASAPDPDPGLGNCLDARFELSTVRATRVP